MEKPSWSIGLTRIGEYYEGIVNNVENTLELQRKVTVTTYGAITSSKYDNKENDCLKLTVINVVQTRKR